MLFDVTRLRSFCIYIEKIKIEGFFLKFFNLQKMSTYSLEEVLRVFTNNNIPNTTLVETSASNGNNNLTYYNLSPEVCLLFYLN